MYLDESVEGNDGFAVVAGFIGTDAAWNECMRQWRLVQRPAKGWHMKTLRVKERHRATLATLGEAPRNNGLILVFESVRLGDYKELAHGTLSEVVLSGYMVALSAVLSLLMVTLDPSERIELIFETQVEYAGMRELLLQFAQLEPEWQTPNGQLRISKWSSNQKSMILEPSDYAAHSLLQRLRDASGWKSRIFAPILANPSRVGWCMPGQFPRALVNAHEWPKMSKLEKSTFRARLKDLVAGGESVTKKDKFEAGNVQATQS